MDPPIQVNKNGNRRPQEASIKHWLRRFVLFAMTDFWLYFILNRRCFLAVAVEADWFAALDTSHRVCRSDRTLRAAP
jgi:hypothetical protein